MLFLHVTALTVFMEVFCNSQSCFGSSVKCIIPWPKSVSISQNSARVPDSRFSYCPRRPDFGKDDHDLSIFHNETTRLVVLHAWRTPKIWDGIWDPVQHSQRQHSQDGWQSLMSLSQKQMPSKHGNQHVRWSAAEAQDEIAVQHKL